MEEDLLEEEAEDGEEVATATAVNKQTNTATPMATVLTLVVNVRHQQKATRSMQPLQT